MPSSMASRQIPFRPTHHPPLEKNKLKVPVPTNLRSPMKGLKIAVDSQNTETINLDEKVLEMKVDILRKWEVVKDQAMAERSSLKRMNKDRRGREAITAANSAIIEIRKDINAPLTLTEINQILYATASIITEQLAPKPKKRKVGKRDTPTWKAKLAEKITKKRSDLQYPS